MRHVTITTTSGYDVAIIDSDTGEAISGVRGFDIKGRAGRPIEVTLYMRGAVAITDAEVTAVLDVEMQADDTQEGTANND